MAVSLLIYCCIYLPFVKSLRYFICFSFLFVNVFNACFNKLNLLTYLCMDYHAKLKGKEDRNYFFRHKYK